MPDTLREQMLASATDAVNALCTFAQDQPMADFDAREERVLKWAENSWRPGLDRWLGPQDHGLRHAPNAASTR